MSPPHTGPVRYDMPVHGPRHWTCEESQQLCQGQDPYWEQLCKGIKVSNNMHDCLIQCETLIAWNLCISTNYYGMWFCRRLVRNYKKKDEESSKWVGRVCVCVTLHVTYLKEVYMLHNNTSLCDIIVICLSQFYCSFIICKAGTGNKRLGKSKRTNIRELTGISIGTIEATNKG